MPINNNVLTTDQLRTRGYLTREDQRSQAILQTVKTPRVLSVSRFTTATAPATAADGSIIYLIDTDATFTSVGFWGRENGAWVKL